MYHVTSDGETGCASRRVSYSKQVPVSDVHEPGQLLQLRRVCPDPENGFMLLENGLMGPRSAAHGRLQEPLEDRVTVGSRRDTGADDKWQSHRGAVAADLEDAIDGAAAAAATLSCKPRSCSLQRQASMDMILHDGWRQAGEQRASSSSGRLFDWRRRPGRQ